MTKFLVMAMPFTGHVNPLIALTAELVDRGHDVRVYTGSAFARQVQSIGARHLPWSAAPDFDEHDLPATFPRVRSRRGLRQVLVNVADLFIATAPGQVRDLVNEHAREPWDVLVGEESSLGPALVAESTQTRWATVGILPLSLPSSEGAPNGLGLTPGRGAVGRARDAALRATVPLMMRPLTRPLAEAREGSGLAPSAATFDTATFSPDLILASGVASLDFDRTDRPPHLRWIGHLANPRARPAPLPPWWSDLDGRRVVYVTQGTQNVDPNDLIRPTLDALVAEDALVVVTTGLEGRDRLPFAIPANARVAGLLPLPSLLPRVRTVITNGGWGGTLAALAHGIPLIIAGADLDKPEVAARVAASGAGINLRTGHPRPAAVAAAYARVSSEPALRSRAEVIAVDIARAGGTRSAADHLEHLAREAT